MANSFHVVLLDAKGNEHGYIGYRFQEAGAQAAANSWNAQEGRELTAVIRDGVPQSEVDKLVSEYINDDTEDDDSGCYIVVLNDCGTYFLVNDEPADHDWAAEWVRTWHHDHARAIAVDADDLGNVENLRLFSKLREARANAPSQQDDSDVEDDSENATSDELGGSTFDDDDLNIKQTLFDMVDAAQLAADRGDLSLMGSLGLRYTLVRYLQSVIRVVVDNKVRHTSDIGMIAKGLDLFCARVIDGNEDATECDSFGFGQDGSIVNDYGTMEALQEWIDNATDSAVPA